MQITYLAVSFSLRRTLHRLHMDHLRGYNGGGQWLFWYRGPDFLKFEPES